MGMRKTKKIFILLTAILLLATVFAGCTKSTTDVQQDPAKNNTDNTSNSEQPSGNDVWQLGDSELAFTAYTHYGWQDFPTKMEDVPYWKFLKENKKVNITTRLAQGAHTTLMATMIADNDLPDLIYGDRFDRDIMRLYEAGKLVPLDDYMEKYPNLKKWLDTKSADLLRFPDGKLYQFPNWYTSQPNGSAGYVVNKKIYKELGSPQLETFDQLYDYLVKVKEKYGSEIIPFEPDRATERQGLGILYTGFRENNYYRSLNDNLLAAVDDEKNELSSIFTDPAFRESQKFISKLYREKLISQDMFTIQDRGPVQEKVMSGRVAIYAGTTPMVWSSLADQELSKTDPDAGYFMIWPLHKDGLDKNKIYVNGYDKLGWNVSVITTAAKDPEKIFAFLDYNTSPEGMTVQYFGPEGGNWKGFDENDQPIFTDTFNPLEVAEIQTANDPVMISGNTSYIDPAKLKYEMSKPEEERNWQTRYQESVTWKTHIDQTALASKLAPEQGTDLAEVALNVSDIFLQAFTASATAKSDADVDKILDQAEKDAAGVGYYDLMQFRQEKWLENKKILGK